MQEHYISDHMGGYWGPNGSHIYPDHMGGFYASGMGFGDTGHSEVSHESVEDTKISTQRRKVIKGLRSAVYEHHLDRESLDKVKKIPLIDKITRKIIDFVKKDDEITLQASGIRVTEQSLAPLYRCIREVCEILDMDSIPKFYIKSGGLGAYTTGADDPHIVLLSGTLSFLTYEELIFVIGHELGHIKSGHVLYHTLARGTSESASFAAAIMTSGLSEIIAETTYKPALAQWARYSELTADRSGYLACQNRDTAIRTFMKLAGFPPRFYNHMKSEEFLNQARDFKNQLNSSLQGRLLNISNLWDASHPYTVFRAAELNDWLDNDIGSEIPELNQEELAQAASKVETDSLHWDLQNEIIMTVEEWANKSLLVDKSYTRRCLRGVLSGFGTFKETPLESILMIEVKLTKQDASNVTYETILLVNSIKENGQALRVRLKPIVKEWEYVPNKTRQELIKQNKKEQNWIIYSA